MANEQTDFAGILPALKGGKTVRRAAWPQTITGMKLSPARPDSDALAVFIEGDMESGRPAINVVDLLASDWLVVEAAPNTP